MIWHDHSKLKGTHAFCSASNFSWRNYDLVKLEQIKVSSYAAPIGTALHELAAEYIKKGFEIKKTDKHGILGYLVVQKKFPQKVIDIDYIFPNFMAYVNDGIRFSMDPEVVLYYSDNFFGTADCLSWENGILQISDLKTGKSEPKFTQLENYAALFCLEYKVKPKDIKQIIFRLYHGEELMVAEPPSDILNPVIDQIVEFNKFLMWFEE